MNRAIGWVLGLGIGLLSAVAAQAAATSYTQNLGALAPGSATLIGNSTDGNALGSANQLIAGAGNTFDDFYVFSAPVGQSVNAKVGIDILNTGTLEFTALQLFDSTSALVASASGVPSSVGVALSLASLTSNQPYTLKISGTNIQPDSGYNGKIRISATPIPATLPLFVTALAGLALYRRRRAVAI